MAETSTDLRDVVERVKERVEIEAVVGRRVQLQRRGSRLLGLCPFHAEKTPSFTVSPDKGFFKCFGCGKGGDVISFVREIDGLEFLEALRLLADEAGVEMPQLRGAPKRTPLLEEAREALSQARRLYREALSGTAGEAARRYLDERGVSPEMREAFAIGWAPAEPGWLRSRLARKSVSLAAMEEAGLVYTPDDGGSPRDRFWDRLVFPVADRAGRTVGFGGRYLAGSRAEERGMGKYVNSPEGTLFPKRRLLYGMEKLAAALREQPGAPILLAEGYLDVILLHQAGIRTALGALGTALTEDHARALRRHDRAVVLMLDADRAGRSAAARAARILVIEGIEARVAELPEGRDPADLVTAGRIEELSQCLQGSRDILEWRLSAWSSRPDFSDAAVRARAAQELAEWVHATPSPALAEVWARRAADGLGLTEDSLRRMSRAPATGMQLAAGSTSPAPKPTARESLTRNEREIVTALLHDPSLYPRHRAELDTLRLEDPFSERILKWCRERRREGLPFQLGAALTAFSADPDRAPLDAMRHLELSDAAKFLEDALKALPHHREAVFGEALRADPGREPSDDDLRRFQRRVDLSAYPNRR